MALTKVQEAMLNCSVLLVGEKESQRFFGSTPYDAVAKLLAEVTESEKEVEILCQPFMNLAGIRPGLNNLSKQRLEDLIAECWQIVQEDFNTFAEDCEREEALESEAF